MTQSNDARCLVPLVALLVLNACSGAPSSPSSGSPSNTSPVISVMSVSPSFGVSGRTTFTATATATDANNDTLTYTWAFGSTSMTGASVSGVLSGDGVVLVRVTVTDGKGGSATD